MIHLEKVLYRELQRKLHSREKLDNTLYRLAIIQPYPRFNAAFNWGFEAVSIIVDTCSTFYKTLCDSVRMLVVCLH